MNIQYDDAKIIKGFGHCVEQENIWKSLQHLTFNMVSFLLASISTFSSVIFAVSFSFMFFCHVNIPYLLRRSAACPFILLLTKYLNTEYRMIYITKKACFVLINGKMPVLTFYITFQ